MIHLSNYSVNIEPNNDFTVVDLAQSENGRRLVFNLVGYEELSIPTGAAVVIEGTKPDGTIYSAEGTLDVERRIAEFNETIQMTVVPGNWEAKLRLLHGGEVISTSKILFKINSDSIDESEIPSTSEFTGILAEARYYAEEARANSYGSPLVAYQASDMTDRSRVYVYAGNEPRFRHGFWYYFDGEKWAVGGAYNTSQDTDETLTQPGLAADAYATGAALDAKVDKAIGKGLSTEDFTTLEKEKLADIEDGSTRVIVDSFISETSENPVQNKIIKDYTDRLVASVQAQFEDVVVVDGRW